MRIIRSLDATDFIINCYEQLARWRNERNARNAENEDDDWPGRNLTKAAALTGGIAGGEYHALK